ncbi:hypothetical protein QJN76_26170, partial [Escherichia coli]
YPDLVIPDALAVEGSSRRDWNRFLDSHYRRGWNVNVSRVMDNATHVALTERTNECPENGHSATISLVSDLAGDYRCRDFVRMSIGDALTNI